MTTKLTIYNHTLLMMKERMLSGLTEDNESRRILDAFYDEVVQFCLEQGMWKFAMREQALTQAGTGLYGFTYKFNKPSDLVHLFMAGETADYDPPLVHTFVDEGTVFYGNTSPLRVRYSSNGSSYGTDLTKWPQGFAFYVSAELAGWTAYAVTGSDKLAMALDRKAKILLANALSLYSVIAPPGQTPFNSWARSITANEAINQSPELQPFGAEVKALLAAGGQSGV